MQAEIQKYAPDYEVISKIGEGYTSSVWKVCKDGDCTKILRVTSIDSDKNIDKQSFEESIEMWNNFTGLHVTHKLFDKWFYGDDYGLMVTEYGGLSLDKMKNLTLNDRRKIIQVVKDMVTLIHHHGWYHGDISVSNVTLKSVTEVGEGFYVSLSSGTYRVYLIDTEDYGEVSVVHDGLFYDMSKFSNFTKALLNSLK